VTAETEVMEQVEPMEPVRAGGWRVVARKEVADHLLSGRFVVLMGVLGIATAAAVTTAVTRPAGRASKRSCQLRRGG